MSTTSFAVIPSKLSGKYQKSAYRRVLPAPAVGNSEKVLEGTSENAALGPSDAVVEGTSDTGVGRGGPGSSDDPATMRKLTTAHTLEPLMFSHCTLKFEKAEETAFVLTKPQAARVIMSLLIPIFSG